MKQQVDRSQHGPRNRATSLPNCGQWGDETNHETKGTRHLEKGATRATNNQGQRHRDILTRRRNI